MIEGQHRLAVHLAPIVKVEIGRETKKSQMCHKYEKVDIFSNFRKREFFCDKSPIGGIAGSL